MAQALKDFDPKTVIIGNQTWMAENLSIDDGGDGIYYNKTNKQYYYSWDAAMRVAKSISGWHLPSAEEWNTAAEACGAEIVANGYEKDPCTRSYAKAQKLFECLNVRHTGYYDAHLGFCKIGSDKYIWSASSVKCNYAYFRGFEMKSRFRQGMESKRFGFPVRLVKDI